MYMHNKGDAQREKMMKAYFEWKETHKEPVSTGSDTNSIDIITEDVAIHVPLQLADTMRLSHTLDLETGKPVPNTGLEEAEIFLASTAKRIREWKIQCKLQDAQGTGGGVEGHTCNFAWMRWFPYARKHRKEWPTLCPFPPCITTLCPFPPCITGRIDRFFFSEGYFETEKMEPLNEINMEERKSWYTHSEKQRTYLTISRYTTRRGLGLRLSPDLKGRVTGRRVTGRPRTLREGI